ncbi:MAG TPA: hypothetical protein VN648_04185, partial [Candidatus Methylomirabilis sp.]|nr:hypothetical protein [Candidatus Methylomirabilis sp.]
MKQLRDDRGRGREGALPRPSAPLADERGRLFLCRDALRAVSWFFTPDPQVPDQRGVMSGKPMFRIRRKRSDALYRRLRRGALLTLLAVGSQSGCTREFYRDWANQDAAEAVFEKSRDPR